MKDNWYNEIKIKKAVKMLTSALIAMKVYFLELAKIGFSPYFRNIKIELKKRHLEAFPRFDTAGVTGDGVSLLP